MLYLLTATGARPEAWEICQRLMSRQDYTGRVTWIIVDDGPEPQRVSFRREGWRIAYIRPSQLWQPGDNTQARNLANGLRIVPDDGRLAIIEDDDWYHPEWLSTVSRELHSAELVGECKARYYNVRQMRGQQLHNREHASLCSTAMRGAALRTCRECLQPGVRFIDLDLWRKHTDKRLFVGGHVVGIKGMPGRGGIGMGHRQDFAGVHDPRGAMLRAWIGDDASIYSRFAEAVE